MRETGIRGKEHSGIILRFLLLVTLWPTVPSLDTQNTGEEADLEGGKGKDEGGKKGQ